MEPEEKPTPSSTRSEFGSRVAELVPDQKVGGGRYSLVKFLGKGGMGIVWLAKDERLGETLALKLLPAQISGDPVALDDMRRETLKSRRLTHPNIIRIHDIFEAETEPCFISMEFVDGPNLSSLRLQQPNRLFTWEYLAPLVKQMCDALDYAHGEKVIHRDLKPANMMLDSRGRLKLADFGIAAVVSDSMSRISLKHSTSGTAVFMSPQQMNGQRPQPSDDIYSLGATIYELLTSRPPFYQGDIVHQVQNLDPQPLAERLTDLELTNDIPPDVSAMVMACLSKDPAQRPQSAGAVAEWIGLQSTTQSSKLAFAKPAPTPVAEEPVAETILTDTPPEEAAIPAPGGGRKTGLWIGVGIAAALVLALIGWAIFGNKGKSGGSTVAKAPANAGSSASSTPSAPISTPSAAQPGKPINLLPLVSLPRDAVKGTWTLTREGLSVDTPALGSALQLPYEPPEEYDYEIDFTAIGDGLNVNQYVSAQGHSFAWKLNAHGRTPPLYCFTALDGNNNAPEVSVTKPLKIEAGKRYTSRIEVRRTGLRTLVNGEEYLKWSGDFNRFTMEDVFKLRDDRHLGVGSWKRGALFHRIEVTEVTGTGKFSYPNDAAAKVVTPTPSAAGNDFTFNGHRYRFVPGKFSWEEASKQAQALGGHLATITSAAENAFLIQTFRPPPTVTKGAIWLGLSQAKQGESWKWVTGEPLTFTGWLEGEPSYRKHGGNWPFYANLYQIDQSSGPGWNDHGSGDPNALVQTRGFIVEWDGAPPSSASTVSATQGWLQPFANGTLGGWTQDKPGAWRASPDGTVVAPGPKAHLTSPNRMTNFEFKAEILSETGANGGMYFRVDGVAGNGFPNGYEAQVSNVEAGKRTGSLYGIKDTDAQYAKDGEWFTQHVIAIGNHIIILVNGKVATDFRDSQNRFTAGKFGLQSNTEGKLVSYRKVMIKPLPADSSAAWAEARKDVPELPATIR